MRAKRSQIGSSNAFCPTGPYCAGMLRLICWWQTLVRSTLLALLFFSKRWRLHQTHTGRKSCAQTHKRLYNSPPPASKFDPARHAVLGRSPLTDEEKHQIPLPPSGSAHGITTAHRSSPAFLPPDHVAQLQRAAKNPKIDRTTNGDDVCGRQKR